MKKENKTILILLIVVIVAIIIFMFLNSKEKEKINTNNPQAIAYEYGRAPFTEEELNINNAEIKKLYSYVYPAHFFLSVNSSGNLIAIEESLFSDTPVMVSDLSDNYRYSLVYSQFKDKEEVTAEDFAFANMYLFGDIGNPLVFFCYDVVNIGDVQLIGNIYRFLGGTYPADGIFGGGDYVLVDVKQTEDNMLELYEAEYADNDYEITSELDEFKIYGKNEQVVATLSVKDAYEKPDMINDIVINNANQFKQHKIIFEYIPSVGYLLYGTEPVA